MSGTPKRLPDEGCHATPLKRSAEDGVLFSSSNEKLMQPSISGCHSSLESGHDGRAAKILRLEQHDANKQLSLYPKNHISFSPDDSCIDHPVAAINGTELKDLQERKYFNSSTRETKSEVKDLYPEMRTDGQGNKSETDGGKTKEKDRKRKDENHGDLGKADKERSEHHDNLKLGKSSHECKEHIKEREIEKREKREVKLHAKRGLPNANDTDTPEGSVRTPVKGGSSLEPWRHKGFDSWKACEGNNKVKKREKEPDADKQEKHNGCHEKESEAISAGVKESDKETFGYGIQQRKRMLRPRGTPQSYSREPRLQSQPREDEGSQGNDEVSLITYKVGECMQEILKSWKEYEALVNGKIDEAFQNCPTLEIRIPTEHVTRSNRQVKGAQLWGTDIYTNDSDLVAVLMHTGYCKQTTSLPPPIQELRATIRVLPPQHCYYSTLRNSIHSRPWGSGTDCSFRVERCCVVKKGGGIVNLEPQLRLISFVEPTLVPLSLERTMNTRAAASNALRQQRFVQEVAIQYNLCNEPWVKYSVNAVSDKGPKKPLYTSARLKKGEVLYVETHVNRYELCFGGEKPTENGATTSSRPLEPEHGNTQNHSSDRDHITDKLMLSIGVPLPVEHVEVLEENLEWEDVQWSKTGVWVAGKEYPIVRIHFLSPN
ncbi:unnamed protein product [Spirodela intermedia]|uniref:Uncharacterized protein n=1 Tax=Spirodela intermedia TaxID=51605 RepID=A0A7I8J1X6_SPIIN|nr:unnamed protein product [Spirodela intermedia]CAA6663391.1 unnamed protein product [Spirodela intermedia]